MDHADDDRAALADLEVRLRTLLPPLYRDAATRVRPASMRSAPMQYDAQGRVAWDRMWATFCDLAMAGGPPHRGTLLDPAGAAEIAADPVRAAASAAEIARGATLVSDLEAQPSNRPGWIRVTCLSDAMAGWLARAIVMENVAARAAGRVLQLPAGPAFRIEKEIKNVVTALAKTCHYWVSHTPLVQQRDIAGLFTQIDAQAPLLEPAWPETADDIAAVAALADRVGGQLARVTGGTAERHRNPAWIGVDLGDVGTTIALMRALVASNVLARREQTRLYVPVSPSGDPEGSVVVDAVAWLWRRREALRAAASDRAPAS